MKTLEEKYQRALDVLFVATSVPIEDVMEVLELKNLATKILVELGEFKEGPLINDDRQFKRS